MEILFIVILQLNYLIDLIHDLDGAADGEEFVLVSNFILIDFVPDE